MAEQNETIPREVTSEENAEPRVAEAVFASGNTGALGQHRKSPLAKLIEKAMSDAVTEALADGVDISDSEEIKKRMEHARVTAREWYNARVEEAIKAQQKTIDAEVAASKAAEKERK